MIPPPPPSFAPASRISAGVDSSENPPLKGLAACTGVSSVRTGVDAGGGAKLNAANGLAPPPPPSPPDVGVMPDGPPPPVGRLARTIFRSRLCPPIPDTGAGESPALRRSSYTFPLASAASISFCRSTASSRSRLIRCASTMRLASSISRIQSSSADGAGMAKGLAPTGAAPSFAALPK